jgi:hypothetical protein
MGSKKRSGNWPDLIDTLSEIADKRPIRRDRSHTIHFSYFQHSDRYTARKLVPSHTVTLPTDDWRAHSRRQRRLTTHIEMNANATTAAIAHKPVE